MRDERSTLLKLPRTCKGNPWWKIVNERKGCESDTTGSIQQVVSPRNLLVSLLHQGSPPSPFLFFPWNPFPIIKDTQMKWTLKKSGFQQGRGNGGGGWEAESWKWCIGTSRSAPPCYLASSFLLPLGPTLKGSEVPLATARINIISVINIKSTLLCFASGGWPTHLEGLVPTDGHFLPSFPPHPLWPFTGTIIYFGEFLGYCFVRANQVWVTNDSSGVVVAWPQPPLLPTL